MDIWMVSRPSLDASWGEPIHLGFPVNTDDDEMYPSVSANGNLYFTSNRPGGFGQEDIWMSRYMKGKYQAPEPLSDAINTEHFEYHALVSEDEQLILFSSYGRPGKWVEATFTIASGMKWAIGCRPYTWKGAIPRV